MFATFIPSKIYGQLGPLEQWRGNIARSQSQRVHAVGPGAVGGKGAGTIFLDQVEHQQLVSGYSVPRSVILCNDFFGVDLQPIDNPAQIGALDPRKMADLFALLEELHFPQVLALRSSALVEDQLGHPAAGKFLTEFHGLPLKSEASRQRFTDKLLAVMNSAYSTEARDCWKMMGYDQIPPLSVIVQEVVGREWESVPRYFFPGIAGIVQTSLRTRVPVATVVGLGLAAVGDKGLGIRHDFTINEGGLTVYGMYQGKLNWDDLFAIDLLAGDVARFDGEAGKKFLPKARRSDFGQFIFSGCQISLAEISLRLEKLVGQALDVEWVSPDGHHLYLVQARPMTKRSLIEKSVVKPENVLLESNDVFGYGTRDFNHIIDVLGRVPKGEIKRLAEKYPRSLIVYAKRVVENETFRQISERILPYVDTIVVRDLARIHAPGTGMQHLAIDKIETKKILLYCEDLDFKNELLAQGTVIEKGNESWSVTNSIEVIQFASPIKVAADDEAGWGMVYLT